MFLACLTRLMHLGYGHPLWGPEPCERFGEVRLGDVGYLREGYFCFLFNAMRSAQDSVNLQRGVPSNFVVFSPPDTTPIHRSNAITQTQSHSKSLRSVEVAATVSASEAVASASMGLRYRCNEDSGALLLLKQPAHRTFLDCNDRIQEYMAAHLSTWCEFANDRLGIGLDDKDIIFVSGFTKTTMWAEASFSSNSDSSELLISGGCFVPAASGEFRVSISRGVHGSVASRVGPPDRVFTWKDDNQAFKYDQCIFLNYFKMKRRGMLRRPGVMRAAAGPHTLPDQDDDDGPPDISSSPSAYSDSDESCYVGKNYDPVNEVLDYILKHSISEIACASDQDLPSLFGTQGIPNDLEVALEALAPPTSWESRVGTIGPRSQADYKARSPSTGSRLVPYPSPFDPPHDHHRMEERLLKKYSPSSSAVKVENDNVGLEMRPSSDTFARVRAPDDDLSKAIDNLNDNDLAALVGGEIPGPSLPPFPVPVHITMPPLGSWSYRNKDLAVKRQDHEPLIHINLTDLCRRFLKMETKEEFSKDQEGDFMRSHVPSRSKVNFEMILAGRKCYRMSKEKNEVVWPPHLEQALIEALEKYTPTESKCSRGLTRFPNRNRFIAEYILKKTGEIRTAKQVGSRIQQLKDTSAGKTIMKAISDRHYEMMHPTRPNEPAQDLAMSDFNGTMDPPMNQVIHVDISVASTTWAEPYSQLQPPCPSPTEVSVLPSSAYSWGEARPLHTIDPTITFTSRMPLMLYSSFTVYYGSTVMHIDHPTPMCTRSSEEYGAGPYLHYTSLAPGYWGNLCLCTDLSRYVVVQEITKQPAAPSEKPIPVMRIHYHFNAAPSVPPLSPFGLNSHDLEVDHEKDETLASHRRAHSAVSTSSASLYPSDCSSSPAYSVSSSASPDPSDRSSCSVSDPSQLLTLGDWSGPSSGWEFLPVPADNSTGMPPALVLVSEKGSC